MYSKLSYLHVGCDRMKHYLQFALLLSVSTFVFSLTFIANSKIALSNMRGGIGKLKSKLDIMDKKIKTLNSDFTSLGKIFKGEKFKSIFNCVHFGLLQRQCGHASFFNITAESVAE